MIRRFRLPTALISLATTFVALVALAGPASAGVGIFGEYGRGMNTDGGDLGALLGALGYASSVADRNEFAVGLATDTNLARDSLTNFRFDVGFHVSQFADPFAQSLAGNGYGGVLDFALGFGILRSETMRLWLGPDARLNVDYYGDHFAAALGGDALDVGVGVGPMVGLNLHVGDRSTITLSTAYNYRWSWLVFPDLSGAGSLSHRDHYIGVKLAVFWRGGDDRFDRLGLGDQQR